MNFDEFSALIQKAHEQTMHLSGGYHRNENIRKIIDSASEEVIGYACLALEDHTHLAFTILYELVPPEKRPPIPEYYAGRVPVIKTCWQYWALKNKYVAMKYDPTAYWVEDKEGNKGNWH